MQTPTIKTIGDQVVKAASYLSLAPAFIMENKLWRGYLSIGWISKLAVFVAIVFSYTFITGIIGLFFPSTTTDVVHQESLSFFSRLENFGDRLLFSGVMKYLILILLETVIFHFSVKTEELLSGVKMELTVEDFIAAQIRMIKVAFRSWIYELIISAILMAVLSMFGLDLISKVVFFLIQSYFLGLAFIDNYNEQNKISIKESFKIAYSHIGAAIFVGMVAYTLFMVPLIGIIITPFICAVGTTTYMYFYDKKVNYQTP
ncbi:MAG: hypothetical protein HKN53_03810 [Maribacter sp.]|nr:hypothetical protein [Maribacter sp.]